MAEGDALVHNNFKHQLMLKTLDLVNDIFRIALHSVAINSPDGASTAWVSTNQISGSGYTTGGATVAVPVVTQDDANNWAKWDDSGANITWSSLAANTILEAQLYDDTVSDYLLIMWEIATNSNGGDYTLTFGANGIMTLA